MIRDSKYRIEIIAAAEAAVQDVGDTDHRILRAIDVARRMTSGVVSATELADAQQDALTALREAAYDTEAYYAREMAWIATWSVAETGARVLGLHSRVVEDLCIS